MDFAGTGKPNVKTKLNLKKTEGSARIGVCIASCLHIKFDGIGFFSKPEMRMDSIEMNGKICFDSPGIKVTQTGTFVLALNSRFDSLLASRLKQIPIGMM